MKFVDFKDELEELTAIGKGWRGIVYRALWNGKLVAVKVARSEEKEHAIQKEAEILESLKSTQGFPRILLRGINFFVYEYIDGLPLKKTPLNHQNRTKMALQLLKLAKKLDDLGIKHGELNDLRSNVLVSESGEVFIIDFDRGGFSERPSNVPQLLQYLSKEGLLTLEEAIRLGKEYIRKPDVVFKEITAKIK